MEQIVFVIAILAALVSLIAGLVARFRADNREKKMEVKIIDDKGLVINVVGYPASKVEKIVKDRFLIEEELDANKGTPKRRHSKKKTRHYVD